MKDEREGELKHEKMWGGEAQKKREETKHKKEGKRRRRKGESKHSRGEEEAQEEKRGKGDGRKCDRFQQKINIMETPSALPSCWSLR